MNCIKCGKEIPEESAFCPYCGAPAEDVKESKEKMTELTEKANVSPVAEPVNEPKTPDNDLDSPESKAFRKKKMTIAVIAVIVLLIVGIIVRIAGPSDDKKEKATTTTTTETTTEAATSDYLDLDLYHYDSSNNSYYETAVKDAVNSVFNVTDWPSTIFDADEWKLAQWSDDGTVCVITKCSIAGIPTKQDVFCILSVDGKTLERHVAYLCVGGAVVYNSGAYNDTLSGIGFPLE